MTFKKNFYIYYIMSFMIIPLGFFLRILYSKTLSITEFGLIYSIIGFFTFISAFVQFGLTQSLQYYIPKFYLKKKFDDIRNSLFMSISFVFSLVLVCLVLIFMFKSFLATNYFKSDLFSDYIFIFFIFFLGNNLLNIISYYYVSMEKVIYSQLLYFFQNSFILIFSFLFFWFGFENLFGFYVLAWFGFPFLMALFYFVLLYFKYPFLFEKLPIFDFSLFKKLLNYGFFGILSTFGNIILSQIDIILITYFLSLEAVAIYSNALAVVNILFLVTVPVSILFLGEVSKLKESKNIKQVKFYLDKLYNYGFFLLIPCIFIFYKFSGLILGLIFSKSFVSGSEILSILVCFCIFKIFFQYNINFLNGFGLIKLSTKIILFVAFLNFLLDLLLINLFGLNGVAFATGFGWFLIFILTFYYLKEKLNWSVNVIYYLKVLFLNIIFVFLFFLFKNYLFFSNFYLNSFLVITLSFSIYFVLGYFMNIWCFGEILGLLPKQFKTFFEKYLFFLK